MTTDTALIEKREELKRRLAAGEYKTLVDVFLYRFDSLIRKVIRRSNPLPVWLITVILILIVTLIGFGAIYVAGDMKSVSALGELPGIGNPVTAGLLLRFISTIFTIISVVAVNQATGRIFILWRDYVLDRIESMTNLIEFEDWLKKACNVQAHFLVTIFGGILIGFFVVSISNSLIVSFVGYGFALQVILTDLFIAAFGYQISMIILLSSGLRRYDLKLFVADPGNSELIYRLSKELGFFVEIIAAYAAFFTLTNISFKTLQAGGIYSVVFLWLPIIAMFAVNHTSLSSILRRAKWKTLNEIQSKVESLQATENFEVKETMEAINRLIDYHDRVKATRDSALDFRTYLGFINSLLLPLLAFILGNLELVLKLFGRNP